MWVMYIKATTAIKAVKQLKRLGSVDDDLVPKGFEILEKGEVVYHLLWKDLILIRFYINSSGYWVAESEHPKAQGLPGTLDITWEDYKSHVIDVLRGMLGVVEGRDHTC